MCQDYCHYVPYTAKKYLEVHKKLLSRTKINVSHLPRYIPKFDSIRRVRICNSTFIS